MSAYRSAWTPPRGPERDPRWIRRTAPRVLIRTLSLVPGAMLALRILYGARWFPFYLWPTLPLVLVAFSPALLRFVVTTLFALRGIEPRRVMPAEVRIAVEEGGVARPPALQASRAPEPIRDASLPPWLRYKSDRPRRWNGEG